MADVVNYQNPLNALLSQLLGGSTTGDISTDTNNTVNTTQNQTQNQTQQQSGSTTTSGSQSSTGSSTNLTNALSQVANSGTSQNNAVTGTTGSNTGSVVGNLTGTSVSKTLADISQLQDVFAKQSAGVTPEMLAAIFSQGQKQVPGLVGAYANAVGARAGGNTPLATALRDLNAELTDKAATINTQLLRDSGDTASKIAELTKQIVTENQQQNAQTSSQTSDQTSTTSGTNAFSQNTTQNQTTNQTGTTTQNVANESVVNQLLTNLLTGNTNLSSNQATTGKELKDYNVNTTVNPEVLKVLLGLGLGGSLLGGLTGGSGGGGGSSIIDALKNLFGGGGGSNITDALNGIDIGSIFDNLLGGGVTGSITDNFGLAPSLTGDVGGMFIPPDLFINDTNFEEFLGGFADGGKVPNPKSQGNYANGGVVPAPGSDKDILKSFLSAGGNGGSGGVQGLEKGLTALLPSDWKKNLYMTQGEEGNPGAQTLRPEYVNNLIKQGYSLSSHKDREGSTYLDLYKNGQLVKSAFNSKADSWFNNFMYSGGAVTIPFLAGAAFGPGGFLAGSGGSAGVTGANGAFLGEGVTSGIAAWDKALAGSALSTGKGLIKAGNKVSQVISKNDATRRQNDLMQQYASSQQGTSGNSGGGMGFQVSPPLSSQLALLILYSALQGDKKKKDGKAEGGKIQEDPEDPKGIKDTKFIAASGGEFVIPTDVVDLIGEDFFEDLIEQFHTPVAEQ